MDLHFSCLRHVDLKLRRQIDRVRMLHRLSTYAILPQEISLSRSFPGIPLSCSNPSRQPETLPRLWENRTDAGFESRMPSFKPVTPARRIRLRWVIQTRHFRRKYVGRALG